MTNKNEVTLEFRAPVISLAADLANYIRNTGEIRADFGLGVCVWSAELIEEWDTEYNGHGDPTDAVRVTFKFDEERPAAKLRNTIKQTGYIKADFGRGPTICRVAVIEEDAHGDPGPQPRPASAASVPADAVVPGVGDFGVGAGVEVWMKHGAQSSLMGRIAEIREDGSIILDELLGWMPGVKIWVPVHNMAFVVLGRGVGDGTEEDRDGGLHHSGEADRA